MAELSEPEVLVVDYELVIEAHFLLINGGEYELLGTGVFPGGNISALITDRNFRLCTGGFRIPIDAEAVVRMQSPYQGG